MRGQLLAYWNHAKPREERHFCMLAMGHAPGTSTTAQIVAVAFDLASLRHAPAAANGPARRLVLYMPATSHEAPRALYGFSHR
eukprot:3141428-Pleurochrysis_carterae.AAC.1